jgi:hypothetical protein
MILLTEEFKKMLANDYCHIGRHCCELGLRKIKEKDGEIIKMEAFTSGQILRMKLIAEFMEIYSFLNIHMLRENKALQNVPERNDDEFSNKLWE